MLRRTAFALAGVIALAILPVGAQAESCPIGIRPIGVSSPSAPFQYVVGQEYALMQGFASGNYQHLDFSQIDPPLDPPCELGPCAGLSSAGGDLLRCLFEHGFGCCVHEVMRIRVQTGVSTGPVGQAIDALFDDYGDIRTQYPVTVTNAYATYLAAGGNGSRVILLPLVVFVPAGCISNCWAEVNGYAAFFLKRRHSAGQKAFYGEFLPPLDCNGARPSVTELWPPNHQMVPVSILGVAGPEGAPIDISYDSVTQDEALTDNGASGGCSDARIIDGQLQLRAERSSQGNGRVYRIAYTASYGQGMKCQGTVRVCVPHDKGCGYACVADALSVNSLENCEDGAGPVGHQAVGTPGGPTSLKLDMISSGAGVTAFGYWLPRDSDVKVAVYDVAGRRVAVLAGGAQTAGLHQISWNTLGLRNGVYFCWLQTATESTTRSVLVLR